LGININRRATIDHLLTRFDEGKQTPPKEGEPRTVLACQKCNHRRGKEREAQEPIEELQKRSQKWREYTYIWESKEILPERLNQKCKMIDRTDKKGIALYEFDDGFRVLAVRTCVKRDGKK
jgi:hypothetical protein